MSNGNEASAIKQQAGNVRLDRSVAYEMINDFGVLAYSEVVYRYQKNMADYLKQLSCCLEREDQKEMLWSLQYIKNCSAQLGLTDVATQCNTAIEAIAGRDFSIIQHEQFETAITESVTLLRLIGSEMRAGA